MGEYLQEWAPTEKDRKLFELAARYHAEAEAYDRTVCTGPILNGSIQPMNPREMAQINKHAQTLHQRLAIEGEAFGITRPELWKAIGRAA